MMSQIKELRYQVMLALYLPILLYAFSTYDLDDQSYVVQGLDPVVVGDQTVVLGQPFQARAYLTVAGGQGQRLSADGGGLEVSGDTAFVMPTGQLLARDESEKVVDYAGQFRFQQVDGEAVQIPVNGQFRVRRPEIVATSEATRALYRHSLNRIRIDVPGLEDQRLVLRTGGSSVEGRSIALSPGGNQSVVDVFMADTTRGEEIYLGQKDFAVIDPPRPELRVLSNGREVTSGDNIPKGRALLEFQIDPDESFRQRYPQDARYSIGRATVYLRKGLTASEEIGTFDVNGNRLVLTRALRDAKAGDRITVRIESVVRINHAGRAIAVPFNRASRTFGFVLS